MSYLTFPYIEYESQFLIAMTPEHHSRHLGQAYSYSQILPVINNGASYYFEIRTPSDLHEVAMKVVDIVSDRVLQVEFYEAPTITTIGTVGVPLIQRNRKSTNVAHTTIYNNPSGISGGTLLRTLLYGAGTSYCWNGF
ncbi:MAG: hypothetical protein ABF633_03305 [Clostridium sp.]|uniref:hypothetical protein n=1 Tax=Clostridium sp. TaxID=1506 RepID=UPI0039ECBE01